MTADPRPPMDLAGRGERLRSALADAGVDGLLVAHSTNVRYLTGFTGSAGFVVVHRDGMELVTDERYRERAADELSASGATVELTVERSMLEQRRAAQARLAGHGRIGLEAEHVSWAEQGRYQSEWFPEASLVATTDVVERLREVKDDGEVARIEAACAIADQALANVEAALSERLSEVDFARTLDEEIRRLGAEDISFETIVASGPNGSRPHHTPGPRQIEPGDLVVIDFGALVDGYHSDMTRTVPVGGADALTPEQRRMLAVVTEAQAAGVAAVKAGEPAASVDSACRAVIADAGWSDAFVHGTGHGVGLDIHESPGVWATSTATLAPGHVVTVEPGVYLPGSGGVRVEDTVVVTAAGCRTLTCAPKY